jgi:hypothetical protein
MSKLNFPTNPTVGQKFVTANKTYNWNGYGWAIFPTAIDATVNALTATSVSAQSLNIAGTATVAGSVILTTGTVIANVIPLGISLDGSLQNNNPAIDTWTTGTFVTDALDDLNELLGKLIPPQPPAFPGAAALSINSLGPVGTVRMTNFTQTNNMTTGTIQVSSGTAFTNYLRTSAFTTSIVANVGPGDSGTVSAVVNGTTSGSRVIILGTTGTNNITTGSLVISNYVDYGTISNKTVGFWYSFNVNGAGTVTEGWNNIYLDNTAGRPTNTASWYYDASAPGAPVITQTTFKCTTTATAYSSGIPHYTSSAVWTFNGTINRLSGDTYPNTDTFLTGSSGGVFTTPSSVTYSQASIVTPLARNLYVASGTANIATTAGIVNATNSSNLGPALSSTNGYTNGTLTVTVGGTVLTINPTDTSKPNENIIPVTFGVGSSNAVRVGGLAGTSTPVTGSIVPWVSADSIATTDATVVAGIIKNDTTNYTTGYFPVGPNLSSQAGSQYITFAMQRASTSKFDIAFTGKISGCWVAMPGSSIVGANGWVTPTIPYNGSGAPGNNGSNGCALGGNMTTGSVVTQSITVTFGSESSSNSTGNYIYVRFQLNSGDNITALRFVTPTK